MIEKSSFPTKEIKYFAQHIFHYFIHIIFIINNYYFLQQNQHKNYL